MAWSLETDDVIEGVLHASDVESNELFCERRVELLRQALLRVIGDERGSSQAGITASMDQEWISDLSHSHGFAARIGFLGLHQLSNASHLRWCAALSRRRKAGSDSSSSDDDVESAGHHHQAAPHQDDQGGHRRMRQTKRPRSADRVLSIKAPARTKTGPQPLPTSCAPSESTVLLGSRSSRVDAKAKRRRPKLLQSLLTSSDPSMFAALSTWWASIAPPDARNLREYFFMSDTSEVVPCIYGLGVQLWLSMCIRSLGASPSDVLDRVLSRLVTRESLWTAALLRAMLSLRAPLIPISEPSANVEATMTSLAMEGLVTFLFPSEPHRVMVTIFVAPTTAHLGRRNTATSVVRLRDKMSIMAQCCALLAPYISCRLWCGMDAARGARFYPAAHRLQGLWVEAASMLTRLKSHTSDE